MAQKSTNMHGKYLEYTFFLPIKKKNTLKLPKITVETKQTIDEEVCISYAKQC